MAVKALSRTVDLVYSPDDGGYYLQEYKMDKTGSTRTTRVHSSKSKLIQKWYSGKIKWGKWD